MTDLPPTSELAGLLALVKRGALIGGGSRQHRPMHGAAQEALRIVAHIDARYRAPEEVRALLTDHAGHRIRGLLEVRDLALASTRR